ncbi:MAG: MIP/aquaporin family protein [Phycisphaerae bacterium]
MADTFTKDFKACTAEALATFALCFIGGGAILTDAMMGDSGPGLLGIALAHGLVLSIAVTATMNVSGGHINPAVSIAMLVTGRIAPGRAVLYIVSQCAGATVAGMLLLVMFRSLQTPDGQGVVEAVALGTPTINPQLSSTLAMIVEMCLTFLLVFAIFGTAVDPRHPNVGGFGIGLMVAVDILVGGPLTGAAMNPARVLGTGLFSGAETFWPQHWVYWVGPCAGAVLGAVTYHYLILEKPKQ